MDTVYWIGADGNVWFKDANGTRNAGKLIKDYGNGFDAELLTAVSDKIEDPNPPAAYTGANGKGEVDKDAAVRAALRNEIAAMGGQIDSVYDPLFSDLNSLITSRDKEITTQYGTQREKAGSQYAEALPAIDQSYAALGSYDSTQRGDARGKAKTGYEDTLKTIGSNETSDKSKLGQYGIEQRAKFQADKDSAKRNVARAGSTEDASALRGMRNDLETNVSTAGVTKATLATDGAARKDLEGLTQNNGRYEAALSALDSIFKSSMGSDVKAAAVEAVASSAGLSDDEKKKVQETYGNVYAEQAAL